MKKTSVSKKILSVCLSVLMVLSVCVVGFSPLAQYANAEINVEEDTGNPVFSLKWNVPESIYLKPGSGEFQYFLTNTLTAAGATAIGEPATACDVTAVAPMADSMTLTYELEANGKKPDGTAVSAAGLSLNVANNVTGAQSLNNTLTGCALSGYTDAIAGNEYFIKWTMKFKVTTNGTQSEYTEYAYTSVYVPSLQTAGSSIFFKAAPTIGFKPRNSVYNFLTGGHTVSGGNGYASRFTSSNIAGLEANKTIHKDNLASATFVSPLVAFTGGNSYSGSKTDDIDYVPDYPFANGATVPAGNRMFDRYTVVSQANGGVYATSESKSNGQWFQLSDMSAAEAPKLNITIDASRFANYSQVPNLSAGWMQYGAYGIESGNRLRWIAGVNTGASYNGSTAKGMLTGDDAKEDTIQASKVAVSCAADTTDERSNYVSLARGLSELSGTVASGHNVMMYAYKTVYDGIGSSTSTNAVIAGVDLNVTATSKTDLRNAVYEAFLKGYAYKSGSDSDVVAYVNAILAADKVLADQFASAAEITAAYNSVKATDATATTKEKIDAYYKEGVAYDYVSFNVPETVYLNVAKNGSGTYDYQYVMDQSMTINPVNITVGGKPHTMHAASLTVNGKKTFADSEKGNIEFYYEDIDTTKPVTLSCSNGMGATYTTLTRGSDGKYTAYLTGGSVSTYASGYITWYVTYTDKVDGYQKSAVGKTYVYATPNGIGSTLATQTFQLVTASKKKNRELLNWAIWLTGVDRIAGEAVGNSNFTKCVGCSYAYPPLTVSAINRKDGDSTSPSDSDTIDGCYVENSTSTNPVYSGYQGWWWKAGGTSSGTEKTSENNWKAYVYFDKARFNNTNQLPYFRVGLDVFEDWGGEDEGTNTYGLGFYKKGGTEDRTNVQATISSSDGRKTGQRVVDTTVSVDLSSMTSATTYVLTSRGTSRNNGYEVDTVLKEYVEFTPVNKSDLRTSILNAQKKFSEYGIYYNGTSYDSIYYNKDNADFKAFIDAYDAAVKAAAKCDGALGTESGTLTASITTLDDTIGDNKVDSENHAIKKTAVSKQYNISYDASGDKILRKLNNAEGKDVTFTESYYAKDDISYTAESYAGYDFLGFIKSTADLGYNGITGSQVMSGTPDYLTSVADYQNQAVTTSGFGATSAVAYPNTVPAVSNGSLTYTDTVDSGIYMIGVYQPHHYTVTYKANGGTGADKTDSNVYGADYNLAASATFTKEYYDFINWNTEADGSGTSYTAGAKLNIADMPTDENGAITLYAQWQADKNAIASYSIQRLIQDDSGDITIEGVKYRQYDLTNGEDRIGTTITVPTAINGLVFKSGPSSHTLVAGENKLVLFYELAKYSATFKSADGSSTYYTAVNVPVETTPTFVGSDPTKTDYTDTYHYVFAGWAQTPNATAATGIVPIDSEGDVTYYAVFTTEAHTLVKTIQDPGTGAALQIETCNVCGYSTTVAGHSFVESSRTEATCTEPGVINYVCSAEGCTLTNSVEIPVNPNAHSFSDEAHTARVAPTCTIPGREEYWTCVNCGKIFSEQSATAETTLEDLAIDATGHKFDTAPSFNWGTDNITCPNATFTCSYNADHTITVACTVTPVEIPATCLTSASVVYTAKCIYNGEEYYDTKTITTASALGHKFENPVHTEGTEKESSTHTLTCSNGCGEESIVNCSFTSETVPPTVTAKGYTRHTCSVCDYYYDTDETDVLSCKLTINYYFAGTTTDAAAAKTVTNGVYGEDYSFASPSVTGYTASPTVVSGTYAEENKTVTVYYSANTNTAYTVKHFKQNADGDGYTEAEADRQNLTGTTAAKTNAQAKDYEGFTAMSFVQADISALGDTVVSIYYNRDVYTVTWTVGDGATVTGETAAVLYGNDISFSVEYDEGHDQVLPAVTATGGVIAETATNAYTVSNITGNVEIKVPTALNKYAVSVKGDTGVTVSAGADVDHNGTYVLTVTAKEDYTRKAPTATANGEAVALVKGEGNTYTAEITNIKATTAIIVTSYIDTHTLTVNYQYEDSTKAADSATGEYAVGADYSAASPVITGFTPVTVTAAGNSDAKTVEGKMGSSDITVTVVYKTDSNNNGVPDEDDEKITVKYEIGRYGTAVTGQNYEVKVTPGTAYDDVVKPVVAAKTGFTFVKWNDEALTVVDEATATDGVITVTATYSTKDENGDDIILDADTYLVKFYNYDGKLLKAEAVDAGEKATAPAETPERGDFTFAGWTPAFDADAAVYADASYTATFKTAKTEGGEEVVIDSDEFVVSFYTFDGKLIEAQFIKSGDTAAAPELPVRNGFTPAGWTPAFSAAAAVTEDASYTATYKTVLTPGAEEEIVPAGKYVVKFFTFDGKLLETKTVDGGAEIEAASVPARTGFTSAGWTPEFKTVVTEDASYTATYKTVLTPGAEEEIVPAGKYVVKFFNFDGALIEAQLISAGGHATAPEETPERGDFTFAGWTPEFDADKAVNADASYTATFKTAKTEGGAEEVIGSDEFVVSFVDYDGALIEAQFVKSGEKATAPATDPVRTGCDFAGWTPEFNADAAVTEDKTYTASYTTVLTEGGEDVEVPANAFVVRFMNYDGSLIKAEIVSAGEKASAPAETPVRGDFTFAGWNPAFNANAAVNADATYTATFKTAKTEGGEEVLIPDGQFVIRFYTFDGKLYKTDFVKTGDPVSAPAAPARGSFTFAGWAPAVETPAAKDASYTATYKTALTEGGEEVLIPDGQFVVRFLDHENKLIAAQFVAKGGTAVAPDMTTEISHYDENGHYGFSKWDKAFDNITADTAVNAEYGFTAHVFAEKDIVEPDCIHNGSKTEFCVCGYEKTGVVIDKLGHKEVIDPAVAATCEKNGLTEGAHCERCGKIITEQRKTAATGHKFGEWTVVSYATETEDGVMVRVCSRCGAEETKTYAKSDEYLEIKGSGVLPAGQTVVIEVVRMPINVVEENVTWTSSDPSVATVDEDGNIMVIGMGQVTLTAAAADGLTVTKTFHVSDDGNTRVIKFQNMDKMYYIVGGYHYIYNNGYIRWSKDYGVNIRVHLYQTFNFNDVIIRANGVELKQNADGTYTVPASDNAVIITAEGAGVDADTGEKISFWQMLINFFRKIVDFFKNLFK